MTELEVSIYEILNQLSEHAEGQIKSTSVILIDDKIVGSGFSVNNGPSPEIIASTFAIMNKKDMTNSKLYSLVKPDVVTLDSLKELNVPDINYFESTPDGVVVHKVRQELNVHG